MITSWKKITRTNDRAARGSGENRAPVENLSAKLNEALLVTMRSRLWNDDYFWSPSPSLPHLSFFRSIVKNVLAPSRLDVVISPIPVFVSLKDNTALAEFLGAFAVVALHVAAAVPGHLHGDAAAVDRLGV